MAQPGQHSGAGLSMVSAGSSLVLDAGQPRSSPFSHQSAKFVLSQQHSSAQLSGRLALDVPPPPLPPLELPGHQNQQQARVRQQLGAPLSTLFPMAPQPLHLGGASGVPPLFATAAELSLLEPQSSPVGNNHNNMFYDSAPQMGHAAPGVLDLAGRARTISSPSGWEKPIVSSGHGLHHPHPSSQQGTSSTMVPQASGMGSQHGGMGSQHGGMGSTNSVAVSTPSLAAGLAPPSASAGMMMMGGDVRASTSEGGHALSSPNSLHSHSTGPSDVLDLTPVAKTLNGPAAAVVKQMLSELPAPLQPVVMAKVAVRGRGGRQPAADPRAVDPTMDPRKVRRILANRQSAARSKMKQRVLLETLRVGKEVMAAQQCGVQDEMQRLAQMVNDLQSRNRQLEERLQQVLSQQQQQQQQQSASHNASANCNNGWPSMVAVPGPPSPVGAPGVLHLDVPHGGPPTAKAFADDRVWWGEHPMDL